MPKISPGRPKKITEPMSELIERMQVSCDMGPPYNCTRDPDHPKYDPRLDFEHGNLTYTDWLFSKVFKAYRRQLRSQGLSLNAVAQSRNYIHVTTTVRPEEREWLYRYGDGSVSAGLRRVVQEIRRLEEEGEVPAFLAD